MRSADVAPLQEATKLLSSRALHYDLGISLYIRRPSEDKRPPRGRECRRHMPHSHLWYGMHHVLTTALSSRKRKPYSASNHQKAVLRNSLSAELLDHGDQLLTLGFSNGVWALHEWDNKAHGITRGAIAALQRHTKITLMQVTKGLWVFSLKLLQQGEKRCTNGDILGTPTVCH